MSFSAQTKSELARVAEASACCRRAELTAVVVLGGRLDAAGRLSLVTPDAAVARRIFKLFKECSGLSAEVLVSRETRLRKKNLYRVRVPDPARSRRVLVLLDLLDRAGGLVRVAPARTTGRDCCRKAYLRGAFLIAGSVSSPTGDYHLEIVADTARQARDISALMRRLAFCAAVFRRKGRYVVYLKEGEAIGAFLKVAGAHGAFLEFENARVLRGVRGGVNRLVNCETANLNRTVEAGLRQLERIRELGRDVGFSRLPPALLAMARLRLANPDASLQELGDMMQPPISKSAVNHRLRRLEQLAVRRGAT